MSLLENQHNQNNEVEIARQKLLGSLCLFTQVFYKLRTGRDFVISQPVGRESHQITIWRELTKCLRMETNNLLINVQPGAGKSEILIHFITWALAHYPDSQFLYISYSHELATQHTSTIKQIIELPYYRKMFGVEIQHDSSAKDNFKTKEGGAVKAYGSDGSITGHNAGLPNLERFSGALIMDDMHKPKEVHSETIRGSIINNYKSTIIQRRRAPNVPFIFIGQRLREDDLPDNLIKGLDGHQWKKVILKSLDEVGNALCPTVNPKEDLLIKQEKDEYNFAAQYQQDPLPAGGGLFKKDRFYVLDKEPEFICTFITIDTAETNKNYNDATVFSFWGLYKTELTEENAIHLITCLEFRVEPADLEQEFLIFYANCCRHKHKPRLVAIEKKTTGVTLISSLKKIQGLNIVDIQRTKASWDKTTRYIEMQSFVNKGLISVLADGELWIKNEKNEKVNLFIEHMGKITANNTHRFDDIADTCYDAVKIALIDKTLIFYVNSNNDTANIALKKIANNTTNIQRLRQKTYENSF